MTPGRLSGTTIRQKKPRREAPSIAAASSSSFGIARRNGTRMTMVPGSANAICGTMIPARLFTSPRLRISRYSGGDRDRDREHQPAANRAYMTGLAANSYRASTYAAITPSSTAPRVVPIATMVELTRAVQNSDPASTSE